MTESQVFSWILLSVPHRLGTLQEIIARADGINHAIPSHDELRSSLGWLMARGLILQDQNRYCTTDLGADLVARFWLYGQTQMKTWDLLAAEIELLRGEPVAPVDITVEETRSAYNSYNKAFWKAVREEKKRDTEG